MLNMSSFCEQGGFLNQRAVARISSQDFEIVKQISWLERCERSDHRDNHHTLMTFCNLQYIYRSGKNGSHGAFDLHAVLQLTRYFNSVITFFLNLVWRFVLL
jgi:hypothetical protein